MKKTLLVMVAALVVMLGTGSGAGAWSVGIGGSLPASGVEYYTSSRVVNIPPWEIAVMRTGGSQMDLKMAYYGCGESAGAGGGGFQHVYYSSWTWLKSGSSGWFEFCLAAQGAPYGSFTATLDWDYDPYPIEPYVTPES